MISIPNYLECIKLLLYYSVPSNVINHLIYTAKTATNISKQFKCHGKENINCEIILAGALLHDIGRCKSHGIDHGIIGANILRQHNFPEKLARICEVHLFAGINKYEAAELGLPFKDFIPITFEEKVIVYADNISKGEKLLSLNEVINRFSKYLSRSHPILLRVKDFHKEMEKKLNEF